MSTRQHPNQRDSGSTFAQAAAVDSSAQPSETQGASGPSRRAFMAGAGGTAAAFYIGSKLLAEAYARPAVNLGARSDLNFLMQRMTRGYNRKEMGLLLQVNATPAAYRDLMLDWAPVSDDSVANNWLAPLMPVLDSPPCRFVTEGLHCPDEQGNGPLPYGLPAGTLRAATLGRSIYSVNRLYDRTVEFFSNHLSIHLDREACQILKHWDDKTVVRPHAFGRFPDMLLASARSPAMLFYLDNYLNGSHASGQSPQINENYARELLELHTVAPRDRVQTNPPENYQQLDVVGAAKVLSGWRIRFPGFPQYPQDMGHTWGEFYFDSANHIDGPTKVLDFDFDVPANREQEGIDLIAYLSDPNFPAPNGNPPALKTARFLAYKLLKWFLVNEPTEALVAAVADRYWQTGGDIKEVLRKILEPANVALANDATIANNRKFKTPYEFLCSLYRATEAEQSQWDGQILAELDAIGQTPFGWGPPDGYPVDVNVWGRNMYPRWYLCQRFFARTPTGGGISGVELSDMQLARMLTGNPSAPDLSVVDITNVHHDIEAMLTGQGAMDPADVVAVKYFVETLANMTPAPSNVQIIREACGFAASLPSFQYL